MSVDTIQSNKLKLLGKLTASLLHEIRNPLSAIMLNLDLIKYYNSELPPEVIESVDDCQKATERIEDLIQNLLQYARRSNNETDWISINDITRQAINLLIIRASKRSIDLKIELDDSVPKVLLNENKFLQVILNLISNAIDASHNKNSVVVRTLSSVIDEKQFVIWEVKDNGVGIAETDQQKIFEDFFTSKPDGTGLGLPVCKSLLEEMNAKLNFSSKLGVGSTFTISFPANNN
ncbi:MAG: hypothetical protein CVV23_15435 [Ignavibacteriae bacterium HGW-Ignavibacteriae-2]|jgi:signal transduction histidine kinase|nr:HAMP domain-containing histidine kinase [Bacteroidota bacterium]PKL87433.1 MAG: hypothetical protein CVV23_15435 [Ignavibacteriae bacterium HGW-Ignavibacteriae-2]